MHILDDLVEKSIIKEFANIKTAEFHLKRLKEFYDQDDTIKEGVQLELQDLEKESAMIANAVRRGMDIESLLIQSEGLQDKINLKKQQIREMESEEKTDIPSINTIVTYLKDFYKWELKEKRGYVQSPWGIKRIDYFNNRIIIQYKLNADPVTLPLFRQALPHKTSSLSN